jgi:hypothetical protein
LIKLQFQMLLNTYWHNSTTFPVDNWMLKRWAISETCFKLLLQLKSIQLLKT